MKKKELRENIEAKQTKTAKRRRRFGDRSDGRKLRIIPPMLRFMPYIMPKRSDALNYYADSFEITEVESFCREKIKKGMMDFSFLHIVIAAYVRAVAMRPALNRFVSGQKIYSRGDDISVVMTIKRSMRLTAQDTCIKVHFTPYDTIDDVYRKFNAVVQANKIEDDVNSFDKLNRLLLKIPGLLCRWTVKFLNFLDYFGLLPKKLLELSPFHGSMIITSMGSLGIKPIYHHIYDFGNLPIFISYGAKKSVVTLDKEGMVRKRKFIDLKVVMDERICDGYYYASVLKCIKRLVENPSLLEVPPEEVLEDVD